MRGRGRRLVAGLVAAVALPGCAAIDDDRSGQTAIDGWILIDNSAERQLALLRREGETEDLFCLAPDPDGLATSSDHASLDVSYAAVSEGASFGEARGAVALGGRTAHVLLAREMFYRTCELALNQRLPREVALALFRETLSVVAPAFALPDATALASSRGAEAGEDDEADDVAGIGADDATEDARSDAAVALSDQPPSGAENRAEPAGTGIAPLVETAAAKGDF